MWQITVAVGVIVIITCISELIRLSYTSRYDLYIHEPKWVRTWSRINFKVITWGAFIFCISHITWAIRLVN